MNSVTILDTDMHIHRLSYDREIQNRAEQEFINSKPTAICSFSLLELKGNYIQCLILLQHKIALSDDLRSCFTRVMNSGGRRCKLMLGQLILLIGEKNIIECTWKEAKNTLLTHITAQIWIAWRNFTKKVDKVIDIIECTRANEKPTIKNDLWDATIPRCKASNTTCHISKLINSLSCFKIRYTEYYESIPEDEKSHELSTICGVLQKSAEATNPSLYNICRKIGDLIIAAHAIYGKELLSSNYKEHQHLSKIFKYNYRKFDIVKFRIK